LVDARTAELRAAVREQESFSYSVSHDLRSPLRTIDGFSHMLLDEYSDVLDEEGRRCLQRVRAASQRMGHLIDALLNLSRMSRRKMRFEPVNLSEIANDILRRLRSSDPGRDAQLTVAENLRVNGDSALLRVVLENLLSNAWKYSIKQTQTRIEVGRINGQGSGFLVRDNGIGFDMRYADKLFKPFQRLHTFEEFEGTGIGLATVVRIIERHGGKVWAEGEEGKGATFYFTV
ncbi:MAG: ATP-binding protein, partial [Gammaproteobacteria bacterium]|nr:ATP-binding protein [Gammaproteobacteria bacterium]